MFAIENHIWRLGDADQSELRPWRVLNGVKPHGAFVAIFEPKAVATRPRVLSDRNGRKGPPSSGARL